MLTSSFTHRTAFTLVELVVTLGAASVVLATAALAWPRVDAALRLDAGLHQVAVDLQAARTLAVASACRVRMVFTPGADRYRREQADEHGTYHRDLDRSLPAGIRVVTVNSGGSFVFSARGQAENGTITLADQRGTTRALRLNQRGRVTLLPAGP